MLLCELKAKDKSYIERTSNVFTPLEHAKYWQTEERLKKLSWLWTNNKKNISQIAIAS